MAQAHSSASSPKQTAQRLLREMPEDASWEQLAYALEMRADSEAGLADADAERVKTVEALRRELGLDE